MLGLIGKLNFIVLLVVGEEVLEEVHVHLRHVLLCYLQVVINEFQTLLGLLVLQERNMELVVGAKQDHVDEERNVETVDECHHLLAHQHMQEHRYN